jgi:hypothetical protein
VLVLVEVLLLLVLLLLVVVALATVLLLLIAQWCWSALAYVVSVAAEVALLVVNSCAASCLASAG